MKILFINLADDHVLGEKAVKALKIKNGETVHQFDWVKPALSFKLGNLFLKESKPVWLDNQTQLIIGAHGEQNDREHIFSEIQFDSPVDRLLDYSQLAELIDIMLTYWKYPDNNNPLQITLSICYAARTLDYTKDHIAEASSLNFKETFAFKFLTALQKKFYGRNFFNEIILKSYIGAVSFNESTGNLVVQTEEQIKKEYERIKIEQEQAKLEEIIATYEIDNEPIDLVQQHQQLIKTRSDWLMTEKPPQPNYGEVIFRTKERGIISIDISNLTKHLVDVEDTPREQPATAPLPDSLFQSLRNICHIL